MNPSSGLPLANIPEAGARPRSDGVSLPLPTETCSELSSAETGAAPPQHARLWREESCRPPPTVPDLSTMASPSHPRRRRRRRNEAWPSLSRVATAGVGCLLALGPQPGHAALIEFDNCLDPNIINSHPVQLQFTPLLVSAVFDATNGSHNLNVTVYGNVSGSATVIVPPPPSDPQWSNPNETLGKIVDLSEPNNKYSTLFARFNVLSYTPYDMPPERFCQSVINGECPLGPVFDTNVSDLTQLPAFTVAHDLNSTYSFTTLSSTFRVTSGDVNNAVLACVSANITPDLGSSLSGLLSFMPLAILIIVGIATVFAAVYSPWGSSDPFHWTSNYGRDADLLRLVTPGFGDCLQYIQFVVLTAGLSLSYPGYYQPVASKAAWSVLMFNDSFVSHGGGSQSLVDGVYVTQGDYGLDRLSQLVGLAAVRDVWAGSIIWLLVIIAAVTACTQAGFAVRLLYRVLSRTQEEDLRAKNLPFTIGNVIRIVFNYFLLPSVALSMFQLVVAAESPPATTALAVIVLLSLIGFAVWLLRLIARIRPRSYLFDDLPTVLQYGPLYNTYSDDAAGFVLVPLVIQSVRGIAIGAIQHSGIAQIILLAICEVVLILTLHAFRPFQSTTSNNAYHTFFAVVRLLTTLLAVAFVPSLAVSEAAKGWIGYVILLMHAIVLVFGFFLNAIQTIVEVAARLAGAGGADGAGGGVARGGLTKVFGVRQLSRRMPRAPDGRVSGLSDMELLAGDGERKTPLQSGRPRSTSGSSALLLARTGASEGRASAGLESLDTRGHMRRGSSSVYTPTTPGGHSAFSFAPSQLAGSGSGPAGGVGPRGAEAVDPYYRPPRRRPTAESPAMAASRGSWASGDWAQQRWSQSSVGKNGANDSLEGPSGRGTPVPAFLAAREMPDTSVDAHRPPTDYAVREVDFYYGVRGPALSNLPTRRLGTGPADPTGPVASATGWFKGLFGGKTKEKGKGFEVVRSTRAPPAMVGAGGAGSASAGEIEPAEDGGIGLGPVSGAASTDAATRTPDEAGNLGGRHEQGAAGDDSGTSEESADEGGDEFGEPQRMSDVPPSLPGIDTGGALELPSRIGSRASKGPSRSSTRRGPTVPRKSSKRKSRPMVEAPALEGQPSVVVAPPSQTAGLYDPHQPRPATRSSLQMPFASEPSRGIDGDRRSAGGESAGSSLLPPLDDDEHEAEAAHARHSSSIFRGLRMDDFRDSRTSVGYVQQHRASDHVHDASHRSLEGVNYLGSAAELVDGSMKSNDGSHQSQHS